MTQEYSDEITFNLISSKQNYVGDFSSRKRTDVFYRQFQSMAHAMQKKQAGYHLLVDTYLIQLLFSSITFFVLPFLLKHYRANRL